MEDSLECARRAEDLQTLKQDISLVINESLKYAPMNAKEKSFVASFSLLGRLITSVAGVLPHLQIEY